MLANVQRHARRRIIVAGGTLACAAVLGLLGGTTLASVVGLQFAAPAGIAATPGGDPGRASAPTYPRNASGLTYGSAEYANSPGAAPDLILVQATNGRVGYVYKTALDAATGAGVADPEQALAWQRTVDVMASTGQKNHVPVFLVDGKTEIGTFEVAAPFPTNK